MSRNDPPIFRTREVPRMAKGKRWEKSASSKSLAPEEAHLKAVDKEALVKRLEADGIKLARD